MKKIVLMISVTLALLSGLSLTLLVMEDKKDLVGRAYEASSSEYGDLVEQMAKKQAVDEGWSISLVNKQALRVRLDPSYWERVGHDGAVFFDRKTNRIVEITEKSNSLASIVGDNYRNIKKTTTTNLMGENWRGDVYTASFWNQPKTIEVWQEQESDWQIVVIGDLPMEVEEAVEVISGVGETTTGGDSLVKGETITSDSEKISELTRPSVVMILTKYCAAIRISPDEVDKLIANKAYPFCLVFTGSGFYINPDGYLATNGHVVKMADQVVVLYNAILSGKLDRFIGDVMASAYRLMGLEPDMALVMDDAGKIRSDKKRSLEVAVTFGSLLTKRNISLEGQDYDYYVQTGTTPIKISSTGSVETGGGIVQATMVGVDYEPMTTDGSFRSSDVAILKIEGAEYPALPLGNIAGLSPGTPIEVIGFPGLVMGGEGSFLDVSSNAQSTVTRGIVSAIKQAKGDMKKLIQTDASINHGNSGGPAVNDQGEVVGVATYGMTVDSGSGNYNFLRDIADLKALADKYQVPLETGSTYNYWKSGLDSYWLAYYKYAQNDFEMVSQNYPTHLMVSTYLKQAAEKVGTPADLTPRFTKSQRTLMIRISVGVLGVSLVTILGVLISGLFGKKTPGTGEMIMAGA